MSFFRASCISARSFLSVSISFLAFFIALKPPECMKRSVAATPAAKPRMNFFILDG